MTPNNFQEHKTIKKWLKKQKRAWYGLNNAILQYIHPKNVHKEPKICAIVSHELCSKLLFISSIVSYLYGGKYLVFVSSRSVKMRGFSFLSLYKSLLIFQFLNVKMFNYGKKKNIIVNFIIKKLKNKPTFLKKHTNWES